MKKVIGCLLFSCMTFAMFATNFTIETSCGVIVDMIYEDHHTVADVISDAMILEEYFCG